MHNNLKSIKKVIDDEARAKKAAVLGEVVEATNILMAAKNTNKKNKNPPWKTAKKFKLRRPISKLPGRKKFVFSSIPS